MRRIELQFVGFLEARFGFPVKAWKCLNSNGKRFKATHPREINFVLLPTCSDTTQSSNVSEPYQSSSPQSLLLNNSTSPQNVVFCVNWKKMNYLLKFRSFLKITESTLVKYGLGLRSSHVLTSIFPSSAAESRRPSLFVRPSGNKNRMVAETSR